MKFISLWGVLCFIVSCQYNNNTNSTVAIELESIESDTLKVITKKKTKLAKDNKDDSANKFFEYNEGCHYDAKIKGIINGKADKYISVIQPSFFGKATVQKLHVDEDNKFNSAINITKPAYYQLQHKQNNYFVYLTPGDYINIDINHATDQGLTFNGSSKAINNFLRCYYLQQKVFNKAANKNLLLNFTTFKAVVDYERLAMKNELNDAIESADSINGRFVALHNTNIDFAWALKHLNYQKHNFSDPRANYHGNGKYLNELSFYSEFLELPNFREFVYKYFDFLSNQFIVDTYGEEGKYEYSPEERTLMRYNRINFIFKEKHIRDFVKTKLLNETLNKLQSPLVNKLPLINKLVAKHKSEVDNTEYVANVEKCYHKNIPVDDGTIAPNFKVKNAEGESLQLADLTGKWAYIAVWATWCAPCRIEQPHLEILKKEYAKNKNIEIFSVSIDEETERWKNVIANESITEPQYIAPGNWNSTFASAFNLTSVPKYILIDPEGQINDLSTSKPSADIRLKFDHLGI